MSTVVRNNLEPSVIFLVLTNLVPVYGVAFLAWDIYTIFILYWSESAVIGFYNVLKMRMINKLDPYKYQELKNKSRGLSVVKSFFIFFFIIHFSIFMIGHLTFINMLFRPDLPRPTDFISGLLIIWKYWSSIFITLSLIFASHGFSFIFNFVKKEEYKKTTISQQMFEPYKRIIVMHVTIILVGLLVVLSDSRQNIVAILILIFCKIILDLIAHIKEHKAV